MRPFKETDGLHYNLDFTRPPHLVTNGPYRLAEWTFKRRLRMVASDYYWNRANVKSRVIDQIYAEDGTAAFRTYERGDVDWLSEVDSDLAAQIRSHGNRSDLHIFPAFGTYYYSLNCLPTLSDGRPNPLRDVRVRKALAMAIDREPIVKNVGRLGQPISFTYIPPHVFEGYVSPPGLPYDVPQARKLLADAGYPNGEGFPHLSILYNTESLHGDVAQIIRRQWLTNLGIQVDLAGRRSKSIRRKCSTPSNTPSRGQAGTATTTTQPPSPTNTNPTATTTIPNGTAPNTIASVPRPRKKPIHTAGWNCSAKPKEILLSEAPIIPLYTYVNSYMFRDQVKGLPLSANGDDHVSIGAGRPLKYRQFPMTRFIAWRIVQLPLILAVVYLITFALVWLAPGSPFGNNDRALSEAAKNDLKTHFHAQSWETFPHLLSVANRHARRFRPEPFIRRLDRERHPATVHCPVSISLGLFSIFIALICRLRSRRHRCPPPRRNPRCPQPRRRPCSASACPPFVVAGLLIVIFSDQSPLAPQRRMGPVPSHDSPRRRPGPHADGLHRPPHPRLDARHARQRFRPHRPRQRIVAKPRSSGSTPSEPRFCQSSPISAPPPPTP